MDYKKIPVFTLSVLVKGLRDDSRLKMAICGVKINTNTYLQAGILDRLSFLAWAKTKDAQKNRHRPQSVVEALTNIEKPKNVGARSGKEYETLRKKLLEKIKNEGELNGN